MTSELMILGLFSFVLLVVMQVGENARGATTPTDDISLPRGVFLSPRAAAHLVPLYAHTPHYTLQPW